MKPNGVGETSKRFGECVPLLNSSEAFFLSPSTSSSTNDLHFVFEDFYSHLSYANPRSLLSTTCEQPRDSSCSQPHDCFPWCRKISEYPFTNSAHQCSFEFPHYCSTASDLLNDTCSPYISDVNRCYCQALEHCASDSSLSKSHYPSNLYPSTNVTRTHSSTEPQGEENMPCLSLFKPLFSSSNHSSSRSSSRHSSSNSSNGGDHENSDINHEERFVLHLVLLSFYKDQVKPYHYRIRKRLEEFHCSESLRANFLHHYLMLSSQYTMKLSDSILTVYLKEPPTWFRGWKEATRVLKPFCVDFWIHLEAYLVDLIQSNQCEKYQSTFDSILSDIFPSWVTFSASPNFPNNNIFIPTGSAESLRNLKVHFASIFGGCSSSDIRRILQISVRLGLLVREKYGLLPVACSESALLKLMNSTHQPSLANPLETLPKEMAGNNNKGPLMTPFVPGLDDVVRNLHEIINAKSFKPLLLSKLRAKYSQRFKKEIDPLHFGFARLSDFLMTYCSSFCGLSRERGRQVVVYRKKSSLDSVHTGQPEILDKVSQKMLDEEVKMNQNTIEEEDIFIPKALLNLVSKHRRFHRNLTFSFWQYCTLCNKPFENDVSIVYGAAATFTDLLFASILRPTSTESVLSQISTDEIQPKHVCSLRWFTREPLVCRGLGLHEQGMDCTTLEEFFYNVLPPRIPQCSSSIHMQGFRAQRPSRLRRQVTSQITKLNEEIFQTIPNFVNE